MFTGLVEETGRVLWLRATDHAVQLEIAAPHLAETARTGDSIAVNGCCLTVTAHRAGQITFDLLQETLARTNLKNLRRESLINLERPVQAAGRMGGHFVQGHIDCVARVLRFTEEKPDHRLEIELPAEFANYVVKKGSIAINGISLTVAEITPQSLTVWIIPHTLRATNLPDVRPNDFVNLEFDILAKYVERSLGKGPLTIDEKGEPSPA